MTDKDFDLFPSPCYIMEEELLRKNLELIKSVADRAGVEIILAFKSFAMWRSFPIFREYVEHSTASSVYEAAWRWKNSAVRPTPILRHIRKPVFRRLCDAAAISHSIHWLSSGVSIP